MSFSIEVRVKTIDESVLTCLLSRTNADDLATLTVLDLKKEIATLLVPAKPEDNSREEAPNTSSLILTSQPSSEESSNIENISSSPRPEVDTAGITFRSSESMSSSMLGNDQTSSSSSSSSSSSMTPQLSLTPESLRLIYRGRLLSNTSTLSACKIESGCTVHLVARCADAGLASPETISASSPSSSHPSIPPLSITNSRLGASPSQESVTRSRSAASNDNSTTATGIETGIPGPDPVRGMSAATAAFISTGGAGGQRVPAAAAIYLPSRNLEPLHQNLHTLRTVLVASGWGIDETTGSLLGPNTQVVIRTPAHQSLYHVQNTISSVHPQTLTQPQHLHHSTHT